MIKPEACASGFVILDIDLPQRFTHGGAGFGFTYGIEVAVDVGGSEYQKSSHLMGRL